jgi:glycyl-tRNA synthetase
MRRKLPFGIAQVRKSFRNEITPGNFVFRTLEFEQMEIEYFVEPGTDEEWFERWVAGRESWYIDLGIRAENLRRFEHPKEALSHYSKRTIDIEYRFPFGDGWGELEGIANRSKGPDDTSWDLWRHEEHSGQRLTLYDEEKKQHIRPGVVEPAAGLTRAALTFLIDAYEEQMLDVEKNDSRTVLHLHPALAPYKACVLPLFRKPDLVRVARDVYEDLRRRWMITYDSGSNIGKLYRRQDEVGTPFCITIDYQTLDDGKVTIRDRDTMDQSRFGRVPIPELRAFLEQQLDY